MSCLFHAARGRLAARRVMSFLLPIAALAGVAGCSLAGVPPPASPSPGAVSPTPGTPPQLSFPGSPPAGWTVSGGDGVLSFSVEADGGSMTLEVLPNWAPSDERCDLAPQPGVAGSAAAISDAIGSRPGLIATGRASVTVAGLAGQQLDLRVDPAVGVTCPLQDPAYVPLVGIPGPQGWEFVGVLAAEVARLIVLDAGGQHIVIAIFASDATTFDRHLGSAEAIVARLEVAT